MPLWSTRAENVLSSSHPASKSSSPTVSFFTNATAGVTPLVHSFPCAAPRLLGRGRALASFGSESCSQESSPIQPPPPGAQLSDCCFFPILNRAHYLVLLDASGNCPQNGGNSTGTSARQKWPSATQTILNQVSRSLFSNLSHLKPCSEVPSGACSPG